MKVTYRLVVDDGRRPGRSGARRDAALVFRLTDGPHGPCLVSVEVVEPRAGGVDGDWPHDDE